MNCIFCKIINGEIPSSKIYEDDLIYAFSDINPSAPVHFLVIPKEHIKNTDEITMAHSDLIGHIFVKIPHIAKNMGVTHGYRTINNCGKDGGQTVEHLHFHVLAGRQLEWPPG